MENPLSRFLSKGRGGAENKIVQGGGPYRPVSVGEALNEGKHAAEMRAYGEPPVIEPEPEPTPELVEEELRVVDVSKHHHDSPKRQFTERLGLLAQLPILQGKNFDEIVDWEATVLGGAAQVADKKQWDKIYHGLLIGELPRV